MAGTSFALFRAIVTLGRSFNASADVLRAELAEKDREIADLKARIAELDPLPDQRPYVEDPVRQAMWAERCRWGRIVVTAIDARFGLRCGWMWGPGRRDWMAMVNCPDGTGRVRLPGAAIDVRFEVDEEGWLLAAGGLVEAEEAFAAAAVPARFGTADAIAWHASEGQRGHDRLLVALTAMLDAIDGADRRIAA